MIPSHGGEAIQSGSEIYLGLGASLGDRAQNLRDALHRLNQHGVHVMAVSSLYESPHLGLEPGDTERYPPHLNAVAEVRTELPPDELLDAVHAVELAGGRERLVNWGPRTIDIDILAYGALRVITRRLVLPHPGIGRRAFVARPLLELAPHFELPEGMPLSALIDQVPIRSQSIVKLGRIDWYGASAD